MAFVSHKAGGHCEAGWHATAITPSPAWLCQLLTRSPAVICTLWDPPESPWPGVDESQAHGSGRLHGSGQAGPGRARPGQAKAAQLC